MMARIFFLFIIFMSLFSFVLAENYDGEEGVTFYTESYTCEKNFISASWESSDLVSSVLIYNDSYSSVGVCNDTRYSESYCCPDGRECRDGRCELGLSGLPITSCFDMSQAACDSAPPEYAISLIESFDLEGGSYSGICSGETIYYDLCANTTYCKCLWDDDVDLCTYAMINETYCEGFGYTNTTCEWYEVPDSKEDYCAETDGKIIVHYGVMGDSVANPLCVSQALEYPCSVSVKLPFFDKFSFIFSVLAIGLVYFIVKRR